MIRVNGKDYPDGNDIQITNGKVIIDGVEVEAIDKGDYDRIMKIEVSGDLKSLTTDKSVDCKNVDGDVNAGSSVSCDNVTGNVTSGSSMNCGDVVGDVRSGSSMNVGNVSGSAMSGSSMNRGSRFRRKHRT